MPSKHMEYLVVTPQLMIKIQYRYILVFNELVPVAMKCEFTAKTENVCTSKLYLLTTLTFVSMQLSIYPGTCMYDLRTC
jgi:hypothetical protein